MALPTEPKSPEEVLSLANKKDTEDLVQVAGVFDKSLQKIITDATKKTFEKTAEKIVLASPTVGTIVGVAIAEFPNVG